MGTGLAAGGYPGSVPLVVGVTGTALVGKTVVPWLASKALTNRKVANALGSLNKSDLSRVATMQDLARLLAGAGVDEPTIQEMMSMD